MPPGVASVRVIVVDPTQTNEAPNIGALFTAISLVYGIPPTVSVIVTEPPLTPVTTPPPETVAIAVLLLLQVPTHGQVKFIVAPMQTLAGPVIIHCPHAPILRQQKKNRHIRCFLIVFGFKSDLKLNNYDC